MITASQIIPYHNIAVDIENTLELKRKLAQLRHERNPLYLTAAELEEILEWKLDKQIGRQRVRRSANTEEIIRAITGLALTITDQNKDYELELRVSILCALRGVAIPIASAILALVFPDEYAVIDYRAWRQVFEDEKHMFSLPDYKRYMCEIRKLGKELNWPTQEVDHAIWAYDQDSSKWLC